MYTSLPIKVHSKCLCILEMIQKVNNRIESKKSSLHLYDNTKDWSAPIRLMNNRKDFETAIAQMQKVKERLVQYYNNTLSKIFKPAA